MSEVEQAILFYSRYNSKSIKLKKLIDSIGVEIDSVSVDSKKVRDSLSKDKNYKIKEVPSVLVIYNNGEFVILTGIELDSWFSDLVENVQNLNQPVYETPVSEETTETTEFTPIETKSPVKEIKKEGPSPTELAAQMSKQREQIEEHLDTNRPLIADR